ncbi:30S ribosomal protein S1 [Sandaracinus amylolyticus]|uniref:Small ribosomal subunit protein bS1 n=1 Tax=Sandaracinus amylolyticus TaxID=927083 RepID=A0A0F6YIV4_9BACT|nr:30S ribosomal protein S1 [Sandaracinus amylolyticus]AKF06607.1 SSU ribosomal protein S1p [Sandaracinus amylolyticus]
MPQSEIQTRAPNPNSFAALFEASVAKADSLKEGEIVSGTVIAIGKDNVVVDIGYKSEGVIPISEFVGPSGAAEVKPGDAVDVFVESKETDDGLVLLSKEKADKLKVWDEISAACERDELIQGTITARVKGGLSVTIRGGVKAFLPGSQVDLRPVRNLDKLIGQTYDFKVIKFNKKRGNIVLSRRVLLEKERDELKARTLQNLEEGMVVTGVIKNITEYGAFVDLGGIDGLLHITDMSWGRVNHPSEVFNVGDEVTVKVLKYNAETERVSLGLKQTIDDPWNTAAERYPAGMRISGKVVSITDYGAFVELEPGIEGLIHVSEMSWKKPKHPSKVLEVGQEVECAILDVDAVNKRISLGLKQLEPDPWSIFVQKYNPGDIIRGKVRSVTDYGVFVGIEEGVDGMVHKSDLSWTQRINNPADVYRKGDEVEAIILSINHDEKKVSLGIKQLYEDPWTRIPSDYPAGTMLEVRVISIADFGVFVELERGVEGLVPMSELSYDRIDDPRKIVQEGQIVRAEIIDVNPSDRRITLSLKKMELEQGTPVMKYGEERSAEPAARPTGPSRSTGGAKLGDVLKQKLGGLGVGGQDEES